MLRKLSLLAALAAVVALGTAGIASANHGKPAPTGAAYGLYGFADGR